MRKHVTKPSVVVCLAILGVGAWLAIGGDLDPPAGPISPTMKTLAEVEPRIAISSVPYTISTSGSYYLSGDVQVDPNTAANGITVNANNVTIDLMGYSLIGPGSGSGTNHGIHMDGRSNVEIRNGTVRDFGANGINEPSWSDGKAHRVIGVRALSNGYIGIFLKGSGHLVKNCSVSGNGNSGIEVNHGSVVTGNVAYNNQTHGIFAENACTVIGNTAKSNGGIGIALANFSTVTGNTVYENQDAGIYAGNRSLVTGNTANSNNLSGTASMAGIFVGHGCLVKGNLASNNMQNNIYVSGTDNAIEENLVTNSNGFGIYFGTAGNFYANNRASGNGYGDYDGAVPTGSGDGGGNAQF